MGSTRDRDVRACEAAPNTVMGGTISLQTLQDAMTLLFFGEIDEVSGMQWHEDLLAAEINFHMLHHQYQGDVEYLDRLNEILEALEQQAGTLGADSSELVALLTRQSDLEEAIANAEEEVQAPPEQITIYINTPGGQVGMGLSLVDTLTNLSVPTCMIATGQVHSMGPYILCAADHRYAMPHANFLIHPIELEVRGRHYDVRKDVERVRQDSESLIEFMAKRTGRSSDEIRKASEGQSWMSAYEAREFGLIEGIVGEDISRDT